jgi:hypothetical protein
MLRQKFEIPEKKSAVCRAGHILIPVKDLDAPEAHHPLGRSAGDGA